MKKGNKREREEKKHKKINKENIKYITYKYIELPSFSYLQVITDHFMDQKKKKKNS